MDASYEDVAAIVSRQVSPVSKCVLFLRIIIISWLIVLHIHKKVIWVAAEQRGVINITA